MIKKSTKKGFSLVELLVVITIIAILSVVAYSAVGGNTIKARDSKRHQDLGIIQQALELYYAEKGVYPSAPLSYTAGSNPITKKNLSDIPVDPGSKHSYIYTVNGTSEYELAAALEVDGDPAHFESYVIGNAASPITVTSGTDGKNYVTATKALANCAPGSSVTSGQISHDATSKCIPYDPRP
jgi:prepilin-type N-terminal cleavage/methylation domain-containing protein